jgi:hypothetical protein
MMSPALSQFPVKGGPDVTRGRTRQLFSFHPVSRNGGFQNGDQ